MKKRTIFFLGVLNCFCLTFSASNYHILKQQLRSQALKSKMPFYEGLFDAVVCKVDTDFQTLKIDYFEIPEDRANMKKAVQRKCVFIGLSVEKIYTDLCKILQMISIGVNAPPSLGDNIVPFSLNVFRHFLNNNGSFKAICDCMTQAVSDIPDAEMPILISRTILQNEINMNAEEFNSRIALNLYRNIDAACQKNCEAIQQKKTQDKNEQDLLQLEEIDAREKIENVALDMSSVRGQIDLKIAQQDFKQQQRKIREECIAVYNEMRVKITDENLKNRLLLVDAYADDYRNVVVKEEELRRSVFFNNFLRRGQLLWVCFKNRQHAQMVETKRNHRIFQLKLSEIWSEAQQQKAMIEFTEGRQRVIFQNENVRAMIDQESWDSFKKVMFSMLKFQHWQSDVFQVSENGKRDIIEVDQLGERLLLEKYKKMQYGQIPRIVSVRKNNPYDHSLLKHRDYVRLDNSNYSNGPKCDWCGQINCLQHFE